ncbi:uncharacterized protein FSUBG_2962 [Fusarium subglutinans]|uniref:Copper-fist domain-containing protein n=1 Tax=Gibberella subglutinans TaxID=42677 RepID=A0A8H5QB39_GIBSU|nr:uncharacterized protein FSUBG_2962 [Fusarium subglutinans]KAF5610701.1 hypothetical protein FSUBG_2962 [Fusarium subglutinans]
MRTNEQGEKIACSRCRVGHRTSTCVDTPRHQDDVQVIPSPGRPEGSRTDPARAAVQREKRRLRQKKAPEEEQGVAGLQQESRAFPPQRAVSTPVPGSYAARFPGFPMAGDQNPGGLVKPQAPVPSRRYSAPPDPLSFGLPEPAQRPWEQPVYPGMDYRSTSHTLAAPAPVSVPSAPGFPVTAPDHAASAVPSGMDGFSYVRVRMPIQAPGPHGPAPLLGSDVTENPLHISPQHPIHSLGPTALRLPHHASSAPVTGFPQVSMVVQAGQGGSMMKQVIPGNPMEARYMVSSVASAPFPGIFSFDEGLGGNKPWAMPNTGQIGQPIPAARSGVPASGSQIPSAPRAFLGHLTWENSLNTGVARPGTLADQEVSASSGQDSWLDSALPANDPIAGGYQYGPGGGYGFPAETPAAFPPFSLNFM